jgi:CHAD domain-containing protein
MAKAWKIPYLNPDRPLNECLLKIIKTRLSEMYSYEKGTIEGEDIEYLHDMRVSSRRVQAALKIFRGVFPQRKFKVEYVKLRTLIRSLGIVRHYDVFIDMLEKYRIKLGESEKKAIDFLIVRQKNLREVKRKELVNYMKLLNKTDFKGKFNKFMKKSLE